MTSRAKARAEIWSAVHAEREALAGDLADLTLEQWATPSLCPAWDVHGVLAHLIDNATTTTWGLVRRLVRARFDFDGDNERGSAAQRGTDPRETLARFRAAIPRTSGPPAPLATRLVEEVVHGEDIRRPLGRQRDYPPEATVPALRHMVAATVKLGGGRERAAGWHLVATDADFAAGNGPEVRGPAAALLLALAGRPVATAEFTGPGAAAFVEQARSASG